MRNHRLSLVTRHLLLESKFIVLALSSLLFLGSPYLYIVSGLYADFTAFKKINTLATDFAITTGIVNKIYQVKSRLPLPGRSDTYVFEFSYLGKLGKITTQDPQQIISNKVGDHVLVLYNQHAAIIEHIPAYFLPPKLLLSTFIMASIGLLLPLVLCNGLMFKRLLAIWRVRQLHQSGTPAIGTITYFKALRHNAYLVEYLYMPAHSNIKLRAKVKATNYAAIGEKKIGDHLQVLYLAPKPNLTCVEEKE